MGYSLGDVLKQQLKGTGENVSNLDTSGGEDRKKRLSAQIELEKIKFVEEVPSNESEAETV